MKTFLRFTDHEGDPLALTNEINAVYLTTDKEKASAFPGQTVLTKVSEKFTVINHVTGMYRVRDTFDEVMTRIEMATELEGMSKEGYL